MTPLLHVPRIHFGFSTIAALGENIAYRNIAHSLPVTDRNFIDIGVIARGVGRTSGGPMQKFRPIRQPRQSTSEHHYTEKVSMMD